MLTKSYISTIQRCNISDSFFRFQVNQGFHNLRQYIPEHFRMKKMSKVDTLHCALEYIRTLELILTKSDGDSCDINLPFLGENSIKLEKQEHFDFSENTEEDDEALMNKLCRSDQDFACLQQHLLLSSSSSGDEKDSQPMMMESLESEMDGPFGNAQCATPIGEVKEMNGSGELKIEYENPENGENCLPVSQ